MKDETMIIDNRFSKDYLRSLQYDEYYYEFYNTFLREKEEDHGHKK